MALKLPDVEDYQTLSGSFHLLSGSASYEVEQSLTKRRKVPQPRHRPHQRHLNVGKTRKHALIVEESAEVGSIGLSVLKKYLRAARLVWSMTVLTGIVVMVGGIIGSNIWLSKWSNDSLRGEEQAVNIMPLRLGMYGVLGVIQVVGVILMMAAVIYGTIAAAKKMHNDLLDNVLHSPMSFFDMTPTGRLLNRFSKDVDTMDAELRLLIQQWFIQVAAIISALVIITYSTPPFILVAILLIVLFAFLQKFYIKTARQIKRIDSIKRSPIYNNFSETMSGLSSIRAYCQQSRFISHADQLVDNQQKVWFAVYSSNRWIGIVAQNIGNFIVLFASLFCVISRERLDPGTVGMSLTFALQIGIQIVTCLRLTCELETYVVAVERVNEYTETPQEAPWHMDNFKLPLDWPSPGGVRFCNYSTRYRPGLGLVLREMSCHIQPGEKIGVVGRTGAGKSSMTLALFRIIEAAAGAIYIDDINIANLGLHDIRSKLTIIPQDPVVFSGPLRFNLDPADVHSDWQVWQALEQAHLKNYFTDLGQGLDYECGEDGSNLSVGQRQLVCLARALLRHTQILILDEATAAVDLETDDLIQQTIHTAFHQCTVITIAHRLNTILDTDRVMVLKKGKVVEFDSPQTLLNNEKTKFHKMAKDAGIL